MSRRSEKPLGALVAAGLLALLTLWVGWRGLAEWRASKVLATVEWTSNQIAARGRMPQQLLNTHLELLRVAQKSAPAEVGIPLARGSQYLIAGKPRAAVRAYEEALALEPRAEIYLNLGRAHLELGERAAAQTALRTALALDPNLESIVTPQLELLARQDNSQEEAP